MRVDHLYGSDARRQREGTNSACRFSVPEHNQPNVEELLIRIGERDRVDAFYEPTSYTWRLIRLLKQDPTPRFDFCDVDGADDWFGDGFAFAQRSSIKPLAPARS